MALVLCVTGIGVCLAWLMYRADVAIDAWLSRKDRPICAEAAEHHWFEHPDYPWMWLCINCGRIDKRDSHL